MSNVDRRKFIQSAALAGGALGAAGLASASESLEVVDAAEASVELETASFASEVGYSRPLRVRNIEAKTTFALPGAQAPAQSGVATLPGGARLYYTDTGGPGEVIVLSHAATGSALSWEYQQPFFARRGYRVIAYSRRGFYGSDPANGTGTAAGDLDELLTFLRVNRKFHLFGTAAGGGVALDYALAFEHKLKSLTIGNSLGSFAEADIGAMFGLILTQQFLGLPAELKELSPSYRAGFKPGVDRWNALRLQAGSGGFAGFIDTNITWAKVEALRVPQFIFTGAADLYLPPSILRLWGNHVRRGQLAIFNEVGHGAHWEQPEQFNREYLNFIRSCYY